VLLLPTAVPLTAPCGVPAFAATGDSFVFAPPGLDTPGPEEGLAPIGEELPGTWLADESGGGPVGTADGLRFEGEAREFMAGSACWPGGGIWPGGMYRDPGAGGGPP